MTTKKKIPIRLKQEWNNSEVPLSNPYSLCTTDNSTENHQNMLEASLQVVGSGNLEFVALFNPVGPVRSS